MTDADTPDLLPPPREDEVLAAIDAGDFAAAERWPRQYAELTDIFADELVGGPLRLPEARARLVAQALMARAAREYQGTRQLYVPKGDALERAIRDTKIWAEHDGTVDGPTGIDALAVRYRMTAVRIWQILREQRQLHLRRIQPDLFGL